MLFGSLALHIVFGGVMGFCARLVSRANASVIHKLTIGLLSNIPTNRSTFVHLQILSIKF